MTRKYFSIKEFVFQCISVANQILIQTTPRKENLINSSFLAEHSVDPYKRA
jgi:hypothetical protein